MNQHSLAYSTKITILTGPYAGKTGVVKQYNEKSFQYLVKLDLEKYDYVTVLLTPAEIERIYL